MSPGNLSLKRLRAGFPAFAREILTAIWEFHVGKNENMPEAQVLRMVGKLENWEWVKTHAPPLLRVLPVSDTPRHCPTLLGALLTADGEKYESMLLRYLEYIVGKFRDDPGFTKVTESEILKDFGFSKEEGFLLSRLVFLSGFADVGNSRFSQNTWWVGAPKDIGLLLHAPDLKRLIEGRALTPTTGTEPEEPGEATEDEISLPSPGKPFFRKVGYTFEIRFNGKELRLEGSKGCEFLLHLLENPWKSFLCTELEQECFPGDGPKMHVGDDAQSGLRITKWGDPALPATDKKALLQLRSRIRELDAEIQEAEENGDVTKAESLEQERVRLQDHFKRTTFRGKIRQTSPEFEKSRNRVRKSIEGAIRKIGEQSKSCSEYFRQSIEAGVINRYRPIPGRGS